MSNFSKYAKARNVDIALWYIAENGHYKIFLRIIDNGVGFNIDAKSGSTGLVGMRERAEGINATLSRGCKEYCVNATGFIRERISQYARRIQS